MPSSDVLVLGFTDYEPQARRLAQALGLPYANIGLHTFPDGESRITLPQSLPRHVIVCRSLNNPNSKLIELLLAVKTARQSGVDRITLVSPYLCYMRQDTAFNPGESISQAVVSQFLAQLFDRVITVDAHLHRIETLQQVMPGIQANNLSAAPLFCELLKKQPGRPLLMGPDAESKQWVSVIAECTGYDYTVAQKKRLGDHSVDITLPQRNYTNQRIVLIDDVISTGNTLIKIAIELFARGAKSIDALTTHALFGDKSMVKLRQAGIGHIWSTDSISHSSNCLQLGHLLADAINQ